jgi:hypothetical protein
MSFHDEISYDAVIPSIILFNENLEPAAIKLYALIKSLSRMYGYCFASNDFLAEALKVDIRTIKRWLSSLAKEGYLSSDVNQEEGNSRKIYLGTKMSRPRDKNVPYTKRESY